MKKGFTLMELLAVIVILAIISLIAVPVVLKIISDAKDASNMRSAEKYLEASELAITRKNLETKVSDGACSIQANSNLDCDGIEIEVEIKGTTPTSGVINFDKGEIITVLNLKLDNKYYNKKLNGKLVATNKPVGGICEYEGELTEGTEVKCGTESFYVLDNSDTETITLLAKYNLNVGYYYENSDTGFVFEENAIQSKHAIGNLGRNLYGVLNFSKPLVKKIYPPD